MSTNSTPAPAYNYEVEGVIHHDGGHDLRVTEPGETPEMWSVYRRPAAGGAAEWLADFQVEEHARVLASALQTAQDAPVPDRSAFQRSFTLTVCGDTEQAYDEALAEAMTRIVKGNLSGKDESDNGAFYFDSVDESQS